MILDLAQLFMLGRTYKENEFFQKEMLGTSFTLSYLTEYVYQECLDRQKLASLKISEFCLSEI